jgi:hypothetical protein
MVARSEIAAASTGQAEGAVPPPGAPHEVAQPLDEGLIADQLARAAANERELKPLVYTQQPRPSVEQPSISAADALSRSRRIRQVRRHPSETAAHDTQEIAAAPTNQPVPTGFVEPPLPHQPAASDTDSPSRGIPKAIADPGKQITGGFGDAGQAQYYPLDGIELRELVYSLMDQIHARLADDLRFSMAITYPRVSARVEVIIEGYPVDTGFVIPQVMKPYEKTPLDVARSYGDEVVFVVKAERVEMTADGESVTPPNVMRQELGLRVPRKQAVETPTGRQLVDVTE